MFLILYSCTRVEEPPTCKEVHALTHTTVPTFCRYRCRKNNKKLHEALMYKNQICDTKQRGYPATAPQRELTGFLMQKEEDHNNELKQKDMKGSLQTPNNCIDSSSYISE